jgi:hypothetical protein
MREITTAGWLSLIALLSLAVANAAGAAPSASLVWTGTTGSGVTGGSSIEAAVGDTLTLDIVLTPDAAGIAGAALTLGYNSNQLFCLSAQACPSPPNAVHGLCDGGGIPPFPVVIRNVGPGSTMNPFGVQYEAVNVNPSIVIGRATFSVQGPGTLSLIYDDPNEFVVDGNQTLFFPPATARVIPEPSTLALLSLGLCGLATARARRR